jgi:methylmalonyl-CoA decarboxylase subunit alpha
VNAMFAGRIADLPQEQRAGFVAERISEYEQDLDLVHVSSELVVDAVVEPEALRGELIRRYESARRRVPREPGRHHGAFPV